MGDHKNTIIAIVLSLIVVVGWQYFVGYPQMEKQREQALIKQQEQAQTQPGATQPSAAQPGCCTWRTPGAGTPGAGTPPPVPGTAAPAVSTASREAVIAASPRIAIATPTLRGSIDLKGGRIDDLSLEHYRETIDPNSPAIVLFSPSGAPEAFYSEFGWVAAAGTTAAMPGPDTLWQQEGSGTLGIGHPVTLTYDNGAGLIFRRTIAVDDRYLFTLKDQVANKGSDPVTLFPYALISRHGTPKVQGYYILHEGLIGVIGEQGLQTETYKKMEDKKSVSWDATNVWLGITDKYWAATLLPDTDAKVRARFSAAESGGLNTYQTDYLLAPQTIAPGSSGTADARLFAGAKEVSVVGVNFPIGGSGGYNQELGLNHFDLLIDWGWFYFITKPMFLAIDYFFHLVGNFGIAILMVTVSKPPSSRWPTRAYEFMAKMKKLQPEMEKIRARFTRRPCAPAAGNDGAVQDAKDQSAGRLSADGAADPGVLCTLQGAVHYHRHAPSTVLWLDQGPFRARSHLGVQSLRSAALRPRPDIRHVPARGLLAARHGRDDVGPDAAEPAAARSDAAEDLQLDAGDIHLHAGDLPIGPGHLLGLEQLSLAAAAERDHAQERREDRAVG